MVRRRPINDEKASIFKSNIDNNTSNYNDSGEYNFIKGYCKLAIIIILFVIIISFRTFVIDRVIISGQSMEKTFQDGDVCWVKKFAINLERNDVVIAKVNNTDLIKRVVGLPNETIKICDGKVYINGTELEGNYAFETKYSGVAEDEYKIAEDEYFLIGDNRENSADSREFGSIKKDNIKGQVVFIFYPFSKIGVIK